MKKEYRQYRALIALTKSAFLSYIRQPSAVVFTILFPVIFIVLFGGQKEQKIGLKVFVEDFTHDKVFVKSFADHPEIIIDSAIHSQEQAKTSLGRADIVAILHIQDLPLTNNGNLYKIEVLSNSIAMGNGKYNLLLQHLQKVANSLDKKTYPLNKTTTQFSPPKIVEARSFKSIDFVLPGQLGFSLMTSGVFGVAFSFFFLRKTQVLKRMFATPVKKGYIILGEGIARIVFQMTAVFLIIGFGYWVYGFTLIHGWVTFVSMAFICFLSLIVFMGMGFLVSNLSNSEQGIPAISNLITIPQLILGGSFFSIDFFPKWLQYISHFLPLTYINNALRDIAFEGKSLWEVKLNIVVLMAYGIVAYLLNVRFFRWQ